MTVGILIVTHVFDIANGLPKLIKSIAPEIPVTAAGGDDHNQVGVSLDKIVDAIEKNKADELIAFYDFGEAQVKLEMASKLTVKDISLNHLAIVEGAYAAASLINAGMSISDIEAQLSDLAIHK